MEDISRTISALTSLIAANNKRIKGYRSLAEKSKDADFRTLCGNYAEQSKRFINNLSTWRLAYGGFGILDNETFASSALTQLSALLDFGLGRGAISRCEGLEMEILKAYKSTMALSFMPHSTTAEIELHTKEFEKALKKFRQLSERTPAIGRAVVRN